jgi:hypothetical protein
MTMGGLLGEIARSGHGRIEQQPSSAPSSR